jgi:hypothetical protein
MMLITAKDEEGRLCMSIVRSGQPCEECMRGKNPVGCTHNVRHFLSLRIG